MAESNMLKISPLFCGCVGSKGHMIWVSTGDGRMERYHEHFPDRSTPLWCPWPHLDAGWHRHGSEGDATLHHKDGWTVLSVIDYSIDKRPGSHATFAFPETLTFDEAVAAATKAFPQLVQRVGPISLNISEEA